MSAPGGTTVRSVRGVRRAMIVAVVGSLVLAAVLGIVALLSGDFGELQARIVLTTTTVAAFGTTSLCHLAVVPRSVRAVGFTGIAASLGAALCALVLIWRDWSGDGTVDETWWKALGVLALVAVSLAQANLLLLLAGRTRPVIRWSLLVTLLAIAAVAVLIALPILTEGEVPGDDGYAYWRGLGVLGILDALGTIALPVLGLVLDRAPAPGPAAPEPDAGGPAAAVPAGAVPAAAVPAAAGPTAAGPTAAGPTAAGPTAAGPAAAGTGSPATVRLVLDLPAELAERLDARGGSREAAAVAVLERGLTAPPS